ncbi:uncharacterized protein BO72DRAFT_214265 [Aspergillus fijiensis CBS 313.89]|uniref:Uncharacterized protein n=1 Tax=Aspergillus fijiensis CBS 313.89 TaxID=1448319 RepID=A0A8G1RMQ9_9EURO|nr:uncharacterized protein BO72DRAFT_214265 [Aspergillus fijiensis CBS 313.89]RAK74246.1 hypothetical protein BO72DRAFT_214265 [Aspergillus fijiensis CBS 313.89]
MEYTDYTLPYVCLYPRRWDQLLSRKASHSALPLHPTLTSLSSLHNMHPRPPNLNPQHQTPRNEEMKTFPADQMTQWQTIIAQKFLFFVHNSTHLPILRNLKQTFHAQHTNPSQYSCTIRVHSPPNALTPPQSSQTCNADLKESIS